MRMVKRLVGIIAMIGLMVGTALPVLAADEVTAVNRSGGVKTAILKECGDEAGGVNGEGIFCIVGIALNVLTYGVGILGTLGLVISGIQYATAAGDPAKMTKAKSRIFQIVIGLVLYAIMYVLISFLIPGGL